MNFIEFESAKDKERIREELRNAREELLKRAKISAEKRAEKQAKNITNSETSWMLPSVSKKIKLLDEKEKIHKKKEKKDKKSKKKKYSKKKKRKDLSETDDDDEANFKKHKVESTEPLVRDDWMTNSFMFKTYTKNKDSVSQKKSSHTVYDPATSKLELNKNWKEVGYGLPKFLKPNDDSEMSEKTYNKTESSFSSGNWRKKVDKNKIVNEETKDSSDSSSSSENEKEVESEKPKSTSFLNDQQMNELAAKVIKNEILGNIEVAENLKRTLEEARSNRAKIEDQSKQKLLGSNSNKKPVKSEHILLTTTDKKGTCRPVMNTNHFSNDKYDLKEMFEKEKYSGSYESNTEFLELVGKRKTTNEDLEDIFNDNVPEKIQKKIDEKEARNSVRKYEKLAKTLDNCDKCFDTDRIDKKLIVSIGDKVYLSLPWYIGLQTDHCLIIPMQHVSCSTELDEDTWEEVTKYRKALTLMFASQKKDVIFFETAKYLHRRPHLVIHCIPSKHFEMAQFYFKKAIQESEQEWSTNKQLITLKNNNLRNSIPKGLPYFWIEFGMESGFAHVLEEENNFPTNFAQEIIGGMLELDTNKWRKPRKEHNSIAKVQKFADYWKEFDCNS